MVAPPAVPPLVPASAPTLPVSWVFRLAARLPAGACWRLGGWLGLAVYALSPGYRERLRTHLENATGSSALALEAAREAGRMALEMPSLLLRPRAEVVARVLRTEGWALIEAAQREGRGILFLTPHLGCFEIAAQHYAEQGHAITVLYREPRKPVLAPVILAGRGRSPMHMAPADLSGVRRLLKALKAGEAVGMLPDQVPARGEGVWAPFFGRPAWTMTLAARLATMPKVTVIFAWAERLPHGLGYVLRFSPPNEPIPREIEAGAAAINRELEALIRACPAQYLWGYKRYKIPAGVTPPSETAAGNGQAEGEKFPS